MITRLLRFYAVRTPHPRFPQLSMLQFDHKRHRFRLGATNVVLNYLQ
jgi:hypothetical protein